MPRICEVFVRHPSILPRGRRHPGARHAAVFGLWRIGRKTRVPPRGSNPAWTPTNASRSSEGLDSDDPRGARSTVLRGRLNYYGPLVSALARVTHATPSPLRRDAVRRGRLLMRYEVQRVLVGPRRAWRANRSGSQLVDISSHITDLTAVRKN